MRNGTDRSDADLAAASDKREAKGVKLVAANKVVAGWTTPATQATTLRFTIG